MHTKPQLDLLLKKLSDRPVTLHTVFAKVFGGITNALLFQQLYFWSDKGRRPDGFIYKTKSEIEEETTLTPRQQDRSRKELTDLGVLRTELIKVRGFPTLHYKVDLDTVFKVIPEYYNSSLSTITEMTPEKRKRSSVSPYGVTESLLPPKRRGINYKKDERVVRIVQKFKELCFKNIGMEPVIGRDDEFMIKRAIQILINEEKIYDLLKWWFAIDKPDKTKIHLRQALSNTNLNNFRLEFR